jgi:hypothetical protein
LRQSLGSLDAVGYRDALDIVGRSVIESREKEIGELKNVVLDLTKKLATYTIEQEERVGARLQAVADADEKRRGDFVAYTAIEQGKLNGEKTRLENLEKELREKNAARAAELDKLRSESSRRQLRLDMHTRLGSWSEKFGLTRGTYAKAAGVFLVVAGLLGGVWVRGILRIRQP